MEQVPDASVDSVVTSPPYNIGTKYGNISDDCSEPEYWLMMKRVLTESVRVLHSGGKMVVQTADTVLSWGYCQHAALLTCMLRGLGMSLMQRHYALVDSLDGVEASERSLVGRHFISATNFGAKAHSNTHQWLVFVKGSVEWNPKGEILYFKSVPEENHPCPFGDEEIAFVLDRYFPEHGVVLDPFMGIAKLGVEVVRRGGSFIGYELSPEIYAVAERNLSKAT